MRPHSTVVKFLNERLLPRIYVAKGTAEKREREMERKRIHGQESGVGERGKNCGGLLFKVWRFSVGEYVCVDTCVSKRELHHVESSRDLAVSIMTTGLSVGSHFLQKSQLL